MKKQRLFSGIAGTKASGKWGILSGKEIVDKMIKEGFRPDLSQMTKSQRKAMEREYRKRAKQVNKKAKTLKDYLHETGHHSESYDDLIESGGLIAETMPKNIDEIFVEMMRGKIFTESETSTPQGVEQFYEDYENAWDDDVPPINLDDKWIYYHRLEKLNPNIIRDLGGISNVLDKIESAMISGRNMDEWVTNLYNYYLNEDTSNLEKFRENVRRLF